MPIGASTSTFTIPILNNGPGDGVRTVNIALSNPSNNTTLGEGDRAQLQIRESAAYTFSLMAQTDDEVFAFDGTPGINDGGAVAFKALTKSTSGSSSSTAVGRPRSRLGTPRASSSSAAGSPSTTAATSRSWRR
jgi:hypothetical protein